MPRDRRSSAWFQRFRPRRDHREDTSEASRQPAERAPSPPKTLDDPDARPSLWQKVRQRAEDDLQALSELRSRSGDRATPMTKTPPAKGQSAVTIAEKTETDETEPRLAAPDWLDRLRPKQLEDQLIEQYRQFQQQRSTQPDSTDSSDRDRAETASSNPFERVLVNMPALPDRAEIERRFEKLARNAKPEDIGKIIKRLPEMNRGPIRELWPKVRSLFEMIRDPQAAWSAKALAIGALIYLISPFDAIPDFIPFAGLADDAALIVAVVTALARELDRYVRQSMQASVETAERLAEIEVQKYNRIVRITLLGSIATALITIGLKLWLDSN